MRRLRVGLLLALVLVACGGDDPVSPTGPVYTVTVSPGDGEVLAGTSRSFTVAVTVDPPDSSADLSTTWSLAGEGTLTPDGVYTAPLPPSGAATLTGTVVATHTASGTTGSSTVTVPSADVLAGRGWTAFSAGDLATADSRFDEALATFPPHIEGRIGRGWVLLREGDYDGAETWFAAAVIQAGDLQDPRVRDALAGNALAWAGNGDPEKTRQTAETLLGTEPDYVFPHDPSVSASDFHWLAARAALDLGDREGAVPHLDALQPGHGLDPGDPGFVEQALALLAELAPLV